MKLRNSVIVDGVSYARGSTPPKEVADKITNPAAWEEESREASTGEPPRAGPGSGREAWRNYASSLGVEFTDVATRDEIIELVGTR